MILLAHRSLSRGRGMVHLQPILIRWLISHHSLTLHVYPHEAWHEHIHLEPPVLTFRRQDTSLSSPDGRGWNFVPLSKNLEAKQVSPQVTSNLPFTKLYITMIALSSSAHGHSCTLPPHHLPDSKRTNLWWSVLYLVIFLHELHKLIKVIPRIYYLVCKQCLVQSVVHHHSTSIVFSGWFISQALFNVQWVVHQWSHVQF